MSTTGSHRGFTIVEMIVVVVVVAVLAAMAAPRLFGTTGQMALRTSGERLLATAKYARDVAATSGRVCLLQIEPEAGLYGLAVAGAGEGEFVPLEGAGRVERLAAGTRFESVRVQSERTNAGGEGVGIAFLPDGGAEGAVVRITNGRRAVSLVVTAASARVGLTELAADEPPADRWDLDAQGK